MTVSSKDHEVQLRELIAYCRAHVETPLGIISNSMLIDLADVAGRQRTWKKLHPAGMTACGHTTNNRHLVLELCDQAEETLEPIGPRKICPNCGAYECRTCRQSDFRQGA